MSRNSGDNPKSRENRRGGNSKYGAKKSKYLSDKPKGKEKTGTTSAGLPKRQRTRQGEPLPKFDDKIRLNKYIANAGICSRREADTLISSGVVSVNGEVIRSEEHTSELQSRPHLVCRLLLEKKKKK